MPKLNDGPNGTAESAALDSDNFDRASDAILNAMEEAMLPFLQHHTASAVADRLLDRLGRHFKTELHYIRTGKSLDGLDDFTSAKAYRAKFLQRGGVIR